MRGGMRTAHIVFGAMLVVLGLVSAIYFGLWVMFIGGIVQIVGGIKATPTDGWAIGWGVVRMLFASLTATVAMVAMTIPGWMIMRHGEV